MNKFGQRVLVATLNKESQNQKITIAGWVDRRRDHGNLIFIDIRDRSGIIQVVFDPSMNPDAYSLAQSLKIEYVVFIQGIV